MGEYQKGYYQTLNQFHNLNGFLSKNISEVKKPSLQAGKVKGKANKHSLRF